MLAWAARGRRAFGTVEERATYAALHQASLAAPPLREGLNARVGGDAAPGTCATLLGEPGGDADRHRALLAWEGAGEVHALTALRHAQSALDVGPARP